MTWLEDRYYVTWCNGYHGPTIGVGYTHDFETFHQLDNAFLPFNRNGVLFPRRIGGRYAMLSRPSDNGHTPFGDIFYSESPDLVHWGRHRHVMAPRAAHVAVDEDRRRADADRDRRGLAAPLPRRADLVQRLRLLDGRGAARPRRAVAASSRAAATTCSSPQVLYEQVGDVPNVVFPCAALVDREADRADDLLRRRRHRRLPRPRAPVRAPRVRARRPPLASNRRRESRETSGQLTLLPGAVGGRCALRLGADQLSWVRPASAGVSWRSVSRMGA